MSRGHGRIERTLLAVLDQQAEPVDTFALAALVYDVPADPDGVVRLTAAQLSSVRRALGRLQRIGLAFDCGRRRAINRTHWAGERIGVPFVIRMAELGIGRGR